MTDSVSQALLVVDMQNDFLLPSSPVCVAGGLEVVPAVIQAVHFARENGVPVIWVLRAHHHLGLCSNGRVHRGQTHARRCGAHALVSTVTVLPMSTNDPVP